MCAPIWNSWHAQDTHEEIRRVKWQLKVREEEVRLRAAAHRPPCRYTAVSGVRTHPNTTMAPPQPPLPTVRGVCASPHHRAVHQVLELQKALSDANVFLFDEREQVRCSPRHLAAVFEGPLPGRHTHSRGRRRGAICY